MSQSLFELSVTRPEHLLAVSGEIHDWFFDIDDVHLDEETRVLTVPFRRWSYDEAQVVRRHATWIDRLIAREPLRATWRAPWYRWYLRVANVTRYEIDDNAGVGEADFDSIEYESARQRVVVEGNIPVAITAYVTSLEVSVSATDHILGLAEYTTTAACGQTYNGIVHPFP